MNKDAQHGDMLGTGPFTGMTTDCTDFTDGEITLEPGGGILLVMPRNPKKVSIVKAGTLLDTLLLDLMQAFKLIVTQKSTYGIVFRQFSSER
jgi:hypothetical protein